MGFLWNHWFWITAGLIARVYSESRPVQVQDSTNHFKNFPGAEEVLALGARGGRILIIPSQHMSSVKDDEHIANKLSVPKGPSVSVSKSVSKVSIKIGNISEERGLHPSAWHTSVQPKLNYYSKFGLDSSVQQPSFRTSEAQKKPLDTRLSPPLPKASALDGENATRNRPVSRPEKKKGRRIDPQYTGYNLVYRDYPERTTPRPPGLLNTIIAKLKSLALATTSRIRLSSLLLTEHKSTEEQPRKEKGPSQQLPGSARDQEIPEQDNDITGEEDEEESSNQIPNGVELSSATNQDDVDETDSPSIQMNETDSPSIRMNETESPIIIMKETRTHTPHVSEEEEISVPRSSEARGRSLPLNIINEIEFRQDPQILQTSESLVKIKEVESQEWKKGWRSPDDLWKGEWKELEEELKIASELEEIEEGVEDDEEEDEGTRVDSRRLITQGDFVQDFSTEQRSNSGDDDDIQIEVEKVDPANISAIIGVVVGIVIFIIISIVLVVLAVCQGPVKKDRGPAEDVISQSSYMTYSTTVSDHEINYGPNWDKDMLEDLCSLDNDSFLNSLEAVTTTDYWSDS